MEKQKLIWNSRHLRVWAMLCMALLLMTNSVVAQGRTISGKVVYASDDKPVFAATALIKGTQNGAVTGDDGSFTINGVNDSDTLSIQYLGYVPVELVITAGKTIYDTKLVEDNKFINEVVVVGYGTMRKKEITGAVSRVNSENITRISTPDLGSALQGQIAGVNVQASSGQPGSTANIQIRGISSINGSNNPLYIVDGVPFDGDPGLSPHEIESIDVLKDAASAAIYGTRGAGGVILITTKSGKEGEMKVSADFNYGIQKITSGLSLVNAAEYTYLQTVANAGAYEAPNRVPAGLWNNTNAFVNDSELMSIIEQDNQPIMNAAITISGGQKGLTYSVVGNYFKQDGVIINSGYERYNIRANSTLKRNKWTINANLSGIFDTQDTPAWGLYNEVFLNRPIAQQVDPSASITSSPGESSELTSLGNVMAKFKETNENHGKGFNVNFSVNYDILKNLAFNTRLGAGYKDQRLTKINPLFEIYDIDGDLVVNPNTRSSIKEEYRNNSNLSWENMLNYSLQKGKHDFKATAVLSMEKYGYESFYAQKSDLISNDLPSLGAATGDALVGVGQGQWGQDRTSTLFGLLTRVQYNYDSRYMISASIRRDASSRFVKSNRWGNFPSISAGWNISEEEFWKPLNKVVNSFKLRTSYGTTGNQNFQDYAYAATITPDLDYAFGGIDKDNLELGSTQTAYSNDEIKWETTEQINLGVDLAFYKSKLTLTADIYKSSKNDMLFPLKIPPVAGTGTSGSVILNVGDMSNKGVEVAVGWRDNVKDFNYWVNATYSRNINEITSMSGSNKRAPLGTIATPDNDADDITFLVEGYEAGAFFMMPTDGVINTDAKLEAYQKLRSDAQMGDLMYVDTDNNGVLDDNDRVYCGSGAPEAEIGLNFGGNYKGFDLSMNWYTSIGNEVVNGSKVVSYLSGTNRDLLYAWSIDNPSSSIPTYTTNKKHYNTRVYADKWVEDGSYIRLRNITMGYTMPKRWISKMGLTKLRIYVAADNILTFTKYDGYDPEVGNDGLAQRGLDNGNYPISAQIRGGVQFDF